MTDDGPVPASDATQRVADKMEALIARQQKWQRSLLALADEQDAFIRDMRALTDAQQGVDFGIPSMAPRAAILPRPDSRTSFAAPLQRDSEPEVAVDGTESEDFDLDDGTDSNGMRMSTVLLKIQLGAMLRSGSSVVADPQGFIERARSLAKAFLQWSYFESTMALIIILNAANIGWTIERELQNKETYLQTVIEIVIVALFWVELALLLFAHGIKCFLFGWNVFDFMLNTVTTVVVVLASISEGTSDFTGAMKQMLILRMLRLFRLFRAARVIKMSRSLWKLVEGLKHCLSTMIAAVVLIGISLYLFACFGAELITKTYDGDPEVGALIRRNFSTIPRIMLTLFQFITMDSTADIYVMLVHREPALFIFFLLLVILVTIMLMNLITAVVVEDAITTATMDHEMKRHFFREKLRRFKPSFKKLFRRIDKGSTGSVQTTDIIASLRAGLTIPVKIQNFVTPERMLDFFDLLDQDCSGELTEMEFVDGMCCLALSEVPLETMQILHLLRSTRREVLRMKRWMGAGRRQTSAAGRSTVASHLREQRATINSFQLGRSTRPSREVPNDASREVPNDASREVPNDAADSSTADPVAAESTEGADEDEDREI